MEQVLIMNRSCFYRRIRIILSRVYSFQGTYNGVAETGAIRLYIMGGINFSTAIDVASTDIETENRIDPFFGLWILFGQLTGQTR